MSVLWSPSGLLIGRPLRDYAVLILHQPINKNACDAIVPSAALLVCADGGGDQWLDYQQGKAPAVPHRLPDAIVGDLDSLSKEAEEHYRGLEVQIHEDPDQYSTDFTKSLKWIRRSWTKLKGPDAKLDVVVFGGLGGRVDQGFSQIHHLFLGQQDPDLVHGNMYLLSEQSLTFILHSGVNEIHVEPDTFEQNVGIIPMNGPDVISTKGLEWDVTQWHTGFGGQLSTSNHLRSDDVMVDVRGSGVLFTLELAERYRH